jgi:2',3'-cyclic-nucleotide 2'-phosphodiesterase (5'-nucleotidase family)
MKKIISLFLLTFLSGIAQSQASQLTILYTGQSNAALFPCQCPAEPAGGVSRRATKIKELRKENPDLLLLETGDSFAGGVKDYLSQGETIDKRRTSVYLSSLKLMGYDALNSGENVFNFGNAFLKEMLKKTRLAIIGLNNPELKPDIIRNINGLKLAVIGFGGYKIDCPDCRDADNLKDLIKKLKKDGADFIIVLSDRNLESDFKLIKQVEGINCILNSNVSVNNQKPVLEVGNTLIGLSFWQARRISRLELDIKDSKIISFKHSEIKLTPDVLNDAKISGILLKYPEFKK